MSPLKTDVPPASLISMLCGVPASLFSNTIWNGASAGAVSAPTSKAMLNALSLRTAPAGADAPGEPDAAGEPEASGEPDAAGEPDGSAEAEAPGDADAAGDADGAADAPGDADAPPDGAAVANESSQQAGYGVEPGAGT